MYVAIAVCMWLIYVATLLYWYTYYYTIPLAKNLRLHLLKQGVTIFNLAIIITMRAAIQMYMSANQFSAELTL